MLLSRSVETPAARNRSDLIDLVIVYVIAVASVSLLKNFIKVQPLQRHLVILAALIFISVPLLVLRLRRENPEDFGIGRPAWSDAGFALVSMAAVFPLFVAGYHIYQGLFFNNHFRFAIPQTFAWIAPAHLFAVALPEEFLYRGYIQGKLSRLLPRGPALLGTTAWPAIFAASALFALGHLAVDPRPMRLGVFFPSILFGWMRERTGSITAPVLFHASANILMAVLEKSYFG
jgi:membrane protease YdiL (CAAX protease family)